jgi:iron complex outermembrane receptor protein
VDRVIAVDPLTTFDISLGYTARKFSILAKMANITDELSYYIHENYSVNPIPPRNFTTTVSYKF